MPRKRKVEPKGEECCKPWHKWGSHHEMNGGGFFGRALFAIGVLIALNALGLLHGVATWVQVLIGIGFALMSF
jgi:hypothetical protein